MEYKFKEAINFHKNGDLKKANDICLEIIKKEPNNFHVLHFLGIIALQTKKYETSINLFHKGINVNPNNAEIYYNLGISYKKIKKLNEAIKSYDEAIKIEPNYFEAYNNRGHILIELNQYNDAIISWKKVVELKPNYAEVYNNLGNAYYEIENFNDALNNYNKAIEIKPNFLQAYNNRALIFKELKKFNSALADCNKSISIKLDNAEAYYNRGIVLEELKRFNDALESYDKAIKIKSNYAEAYNNRGNVLKILKKLELSSKSYNEAFKINPSMDFLLGSLIFSKIRLCNWHFLNEDLEELKDKILKGKKVSMPWNAISFYESMEIQKKTAQIYLNEKFPSKKKNNLTLKKKSNNKIKIGYFSADFRNHPVCYQLANLFELHDKSKFEIIAFSYGPKANDETYKRIFKVFDQFIDVQLKTDIEIADLSKELEIDIAVDLTGFTKHMRFGIFINRCAPIQINYLGYPGTSGSNCIDYIIGDKILIPEESQKHYSEKIIYLPNSYWAMDSKRKIPHKNFTREELGLPSKSFVFCCFNRHYKLNPGIFNIWMKILKQVEDSVLWLNNENNISTNNLKKKIKQTNIDQKRIIFADRMNSMEDHLARHKSADLFLDTYPFGSHTTSSDSLLVGLPVVTLVGQSFASNVAASQLNTINIPELITHTKEEYENLILDLATDKNKLNQIKDKLIKNRLTTPLFDTKLYTKNIESAYIKIYERHLNNLPIENIEI